MREYGGDIQFICHESQILARKHVSFEDFFKNAITP